MMIWTTHDIIKEIKNQGKSDLFQDLYGEIEDDSAELNRITDLMVRSKDPVTHLFSAPGRTELGGNHTDHNLGVVLCAAVQKDMLAAVSKRVDNKVVIRSDGYSEIFEMDISDLGKRSSEKGKTNALIRGVLAGIDESGGQIGGFSAEITSNVGIGSGLSSSASFEILIGTIVNNLFNESKLLPEQIAQIGQFAENIFFGKPCGLMDQTASAIGGIMKIDFADPSHIDIQKVRFDMDTTDYVLVVVNTGSSHADLTPAYASIPAEMSAVAQELGSELLRSQNENLLYDKMTIIRPKLGDRAVLRAMHFFRENNRVQQMVAALESTDFNTFLEKVAASGASSQNVLQNAIPPQSDGMEQGLGFALGISQSFFEQTGRGVARVHGGGFAGAIQAYVHKEDFQEYSDCVSKIISPNALSVLNIRQHGACEILSLK